MQQTPLIYSQKKHLYGSDTDLYSRWRPSCIFDAMQCVAGDHAEAMGFGSIAMLEKGITWVLSRIQLDMQRYPCCAETIELITWPGTPKRFFYPRYFLLRDQSGNPLGQASTLWAVFDVQTRQRSAFDQKGMEYVVPTDQPDLSMPAKIHLPKTLEHQRHIPIAYNDLDINGHVNNTRYVEWLTNLVPYPVYAQRTFSRFQVEYIAEVLPGTPLQLCWSLQPDGIYAMGINEQTQQKHFSAIARYADAPGQ